MSRWLLTLVALTLVALTLLLPVLAQAQPTCPAATQPTPTFDIQPDSDHSPLVQETTDAGTYVELIACLHDGATTGYYTGTINNLFFDNQGHYLGSNGQALVDRKGDPLPAGAPHLFGAGTPLGYPTQPGSVATQVLVQASVTPCSGPSIVSCSALPTPHLVLFQTGSPPTTPQPDGSTNCGHPPAAAALSDTDPTHPLFRFFAEGLLRVADSADGKTTNVTILSCLRLIPPDTAIPTGYYQGRATAFVFGRQGAILGDGTQTIGIGGQPLDTLQVPSPYIAHANTALIDGIAGIHDFGVTIAVPLTSHDAIDPHVLIAVTLKPCKPDLSACDGPPHTYHRLLTACAPDLPDFDRTRCPSFGP